MLRKPPKMGATDENGKGAWHEGLQHIERGIDAVNVLRVEMRKAGMTDCADTLDKAFAHCIREYLVLKGDFDAAPQDTDRDKSN